MSNDSKLGISDASFASDISHDSQELDTCIALYKAQLEQGEIQKAYHYLLRYLMHLKAHLSGSMSTEFSFGNISSGYMDFSYFPFFDQYLRARKLRFGIVLNHKALRFELWLMGQNAMVQNAFWRKLKSSPWSAGRTERPQYSTLETVLVETPNFKQTDQLTLKIKAEAMRAAETITEAIRTADGHDN